MANFARLHPVLIAGALACGAASMGCGMLSAVTNPSAAFAISEPSNLGVVVRRAEIARATSNEVDRLLGSSPLDDDSAWLDKVVLTKDDATGLVKASAAESVYDGSGTRVVSAEAWAHSLGGLCPDGSAHPNVIAASGPDAAKLYADIVAERKQIGKLKADAEAAKTAKQEAKGDQLTAEAEKLETANEAKVSQLVESLKKPSTATGPLKDKLKAVVINLSAAVKDAQSANSAAMLGYPLALKGLTSEVQKAAPRFVADVIEDKTGTRPKTGGLKPEVKLDGTDVKLTINGMTTEQLSSLSVGDVVSETTSRLTAYVKLAVSIPVFASDTADLLGLQEKLLEAYLTGLGGGGTPVDLSATAIQAGQPGQPPAAGGAKPPTGKGKRWPGGLKIVNACKPAKDDDKVIAAVAPVPAPAGAAPAPAAEAKPAAEPKTAEAKQPETEAKDPPKAKEEDAKPADEPAKSEPTADAKPAEAPKPADSSGGSPLKTIGFITAGVGVAGLIGGGVLGFVALNKHSDLERSCDGENCPPAYASAVDDYRMIGNLSTAVLIGGGALTAVGVALIVAAPSSGPGKEQSKRKPGVTAYIGVGTVGAVGRF